MTEYETDSDRKLQLGGITEAQNGRGKSRFHTKCKMNGYRKKKLNFTYS